MSNDTNEQWQTWNEELSCSVCFYHQQSRIWSFWPPSYYSEMLWTYSSLFVNIFVCLPPKGATLFLDLWFSCTSVQLSYAKNKHVYKLYWAPGNLGSLKTLQSNLKLENNSSEVKAVRCMPVFSLAIGIKLIYFCFYLKTIKVILIFTMCVHAGGCKGGGKFSLKFRKLSMGTLALEFGKSQHYLH